MENKIALSISEASIYTGIGQNNLRQLVAWQKLPAIYVGKKILIRVETLDDFMKLNEGNNLTDRYQVA